MSRNRLPRFAAPALLLGASGFRPRRNKIMVLWEMDVTRQLTVEASGAWPA